MHRGFSLCLLAFRITGTMAALGRRLLQVRRARKVGRRVLLCKLGSVPALDVCPSARVALLGSACTLSAVGCVMAPNARQTPVRGRGKGGCGSGPNAAAVVPICVSAMPPCAAWRELASIADMKEAKG